MAACRLIPKTDDAEFPYDEAMRLLITEQPSMAFQPKDFTPLIAAGRDFAGWPPEVINEHQDMANRGRCFDFRQEQPPYLQGTLFEDNIWFSFHSANHETSCLEVIESLRQKLDVRIHHY